MPDNIKIIAILAIALSLACLFGYFSQKLKLSPIIGYLFAGFILGPHCPGFIVDQNISDQLAMIGVTLLMFAVGLNFNWKDLSAVKKISLPGAVLLSTLSICAGISLSLYIGESLIEGFVIGIAISVSSTVVIVRVLTDQNLLHTKQGHIVVGWTIVEDLISVFGLILLPALVQYTTSLSFSILLVFIKVFLLGLIVYFIGDKLIEKLLKGIARTRSHELFTLAILAVVFTIAVSSSYFFGISLALGAFIAGTVVGKTELSHQAAANALPMRDAFSVLFFVSVGMLFNPFVLPNNLVLFFGTLCILLLLRPIFCFCIVKIAKYQSCVAMTCALAISQIGEYSFIIAEEGSRLKILPDNAYDILVACSFITIGLNPILFQLFKSVLKEKHPISKAYQNNILYSNKTSKESFLPRALVVGFGPVGKAIAHFLKEDYDVLVIEQNIDTVSSVHEKNIELLFGDATQLQLLERANVENIPLVVITTPDREITLSIIEAVHHINPQAKIIARVHFKSEYDRTKYGDIPIIFDEDATVDKMISAIEKEKH